MEPARIERARIESAAAWHGPEMTRRSDWIHTLGREEVSEMSAAVASVRKRGIDIDDISRENFPLPRFAELAQKALDYLENGPGMFLIRGLPVFEHSVDEMRLIYWGMGKYLGTAVAQSKKGDVLGDVRDLGVFKDKLGRGYQNAKSQPWHADHCDVVGLLVLRTAKSGGLSKIVSSISLHNEIFRERPDLLEVLYQPFNLYSPDVGEHHYQQPVFSMQDGYFACKTAGLYARMALQRFPELPPLTPQQLDALDLFQAVPNRPELIFTMMFQPGDLQLLNNHVTLHCRTAFEDYEEEDRKRHLLRLWLAVPNSRPLAPLMAGIFRGGAPGSLRGGYPSHGKRVFESLVE